MDSLYFPFCHINDKSFQKIVNGSRYHLYLLEEINNISCNPFEESNILNSVDKFIRGNDSVQVCKYYFCEDFHDISDALADRKLLSYNISSLPLHNDSFQYQCLNEVGAKFDVIGLCETRLNKNILSLYTLTSYNVFHINRGTSGYGELIYLRTKFQGKIRPYIENWFVEVIGKSKFSL